MMDVLLLVMLIGLIHKLMRRLEFQGWKAHHVKGEWTRWQ